jgi:hypothetical protein
MNNLRTLLWIYLVLLILEGAIRKWVLPMLDAPLLVIRDPLVILIYYQALQQRLSFHNAFFTPNLFLAGACTFISVFGYGNPLVTAYGLRTDFLQIPLIFIIPQILNRHDVLAMGRFMFYVSIPIAVLVLIQFRSSPDSKINVGSLATHYGTVRPSGPFSFISGIISFYALVAAFLFYGFIHVRTYRIWLMAATTIALILVTACSGSRSCLVMVGLVAATGLACVMVRGKGGFGIIVAGALVGLALVVLSTTSIGQEGSAQLIQRFSDVASQENGTEGFVGRFVNTMLKPIEEMGEVPIFGNGVGIGTNAAAGLLRGGREFIGPEDEWGRLIFECGPLFGFLLCVFRIVLFVSIGLRAYRALRYDNILPMLIYAACGLLVLNGQWGVPTVLGFAMFGSGLALAACIDPWDDEEEYEDEHGEHHEHDEHESDHSHATEPAE